MNDLVIRSSELNDASAVESLRVASWRAGFREILPKAYLEQMSGDVMQRERDTKHRHRVGVDLVAVRNGDVVGWASAGPCRDPDLDSAEYAEIYACYVLPDQWRHGVGRQLVDELISKLKYLRPDIFTCWILRDNVRSRSMAESFGFTVDGTERSFDDAGTPVSMLRYTRSVII